MNASASSLDRSVLTNSVCWLLCALAGLVICAAIAQAQTADRKPTASTPAGEWHTFGDGGGQPRAVVRITEAAGVYTGRILRSLVPGEDPDKLCSKCTDERKDKLLRGMAIITGMKPVDGAYSGGEILDPDTGGIYRSTMMLSADGRRLTVRGYIGIPLFGRTQEWIRAE